MVLGHGGAGAGHGGGTGVGHDGGSSIGHGDMGKAWARMAQARARGKVAAAWAWEQGGAVSYGGVARVCLVMSA